MDRSSLILCLILLMILAIVVNSISIFIVEGCATSNNVDYIVTDNLNKGIWTQGETKVKFQCSCGKGKFQIMGIVPRWREYQIEIMEITCGCGKSAQFGLVLHRLVTRLTGVELH